MSYSIFPHRTNDPKTEVTLPVGAHVLRLTVKDDAGMVSAPDIVTIVVEKTGQPATTHVDPDEGRRGSTIDAVIFGANLQDATAVKVYLGAQEDTRVRVVVRKGATSEQLPVTIRISAQAALGSRIFEVITPHGVATESFDVIAHEAPVILGIAPVWALPNAMRPIPARIEGDHLEQAETVTFLRGAKEDPGIHAIIRRANVEYLDVDLTISANAEYGRRRFAVTTPAGTTVSLPAITFTVFPGYLPSSIMLLTLITALIHLFLDFPNALFILNGLGYLALLVGLYAPTRWLFTGLRPIMRWVLLGYAVLTIVVWIAMGDRTLLAYITKAVEVLLVLLLVVESQQS